MIIQHPFHNNGEQFDTKSIAGNKLASFVGNCADIALEAKDLKINRLQENNQELVEALKVNHDHWNYTDDYIKKCGLVSKENCQYCQLIAKNKE